MRLISVFNILFLLVIGIISSIAQAAGEKTKLEQKWLEILKKSSISNQIITLKTTKGPATALYLPQTSGRPQGGLIILHARQQHPDWHELISPLRMRFPKFGWATLSLQLPLLPDTTPLKDYVQTTETSAARINAAIKYLNARDIRNVVIIGYEMGANTATWFLRKNPTARVYAFISISLLVDTKPKQPNTNHALSLIKQPVLDIYASNDTRDILASAIERRPLIRQHRNLRTSSRKATSVRYRQLKIYGADHTYTGYENYLIKRVRSWLRVFAPGKSIKNK